MLSIIMPVKNTARYLNECIDSILNQTFIDWELIVVDDSSTDESLSVLEGYAAKEQRIKVTQNNGLGIIEALQTGYKIATGDYITRMDSDDINESLKYGQMMAQLYKKGIGHIALGQVNYFSADGVQDGFRQYEAWLNRLINKGNCFDEIYKECVIPSPCWMLHRADFDKIGGFESKLYPEDYDLCFRMYQAALIPIPSKEVLFYWRDYPTRTSRTDANYMASELLKIKCHYFLKIDFVKNKNLVLWGAGRRGKYIANYLVEKEIPFTWVCNNENKIGHNIYGVILKSEISLTGIADKQIVVSVANRAARLAIEAECKSAEWEAYFFC